MLKNEQICVDLFRVIIAKLVAVIAIVVVEMAAVVLILIVMPMVTAILKVKNCNFMGY